MENSQAFSAGYILGRALAPIIFGSLIAFIYAKVKKQKFSWKVAIISAVILFALSLLGKTSSLKNSVQQPVWNEAEYKTGFIKGCEKEGGAADYCSCTADAMLRAYSGEELLALGKDIQSGKYKSPEEYPEKFKEALFACISPVPESN